MIALFPCRTTLAVTAASTSLLASPRAGQRAHRQSFAPCKTNSFADAATRRNLEDVASEICAIAPHPPGANMTLDFGDQINFRASSAEPMMGAMSGFWPKVSPKRSTMSPFLLRDWNTIG